MAEKSTSDDSTESRDYDIEGDHNTAGDIRISGPVSGNIVIGGNLTQSSTSTSSTDDQVGQLNETQTTSVGDAWLSRWLSNRAIVILILCVALVGLCLTVSLGGYIWGLTSNQIEITIRISAKADGKAIPRARVILFTEGTRQVGSTDSTGVVSFSVSSSQQGIPVSLIVETDTHGIEEIQNIQVPQDGFINIHLDEKEAQAEAIVLVVDKDLAALAGATIVLLVDGETYSQVTDSNGLAKFTADFSADTIDAQIRVSAEGFETDDQHITLQPNTTVGIQLNQAANSFQEINIFKP